MEESLVAGLDERVALRMDRLDGEVADLLTGQGLDDFLRDLLGRVSGLGSHPGDERAEGEPLGDEGAAGHEQRDQLQQGPHRRRERKVCAAARVTAPRVPAQTMTAPSRGPSGVRVQ